MKKVSLTLLLFVALVSPALAQLTIPEFGRFLGKKFRVSKAYTSNCDFHYFSILLHTDSQDKVSHLEYKTEVTEDMKKMFEFLEGYQFPSKYSINKRPVLFFVTINKSNFCPDVLVSPNIVNDALRNNLKLIEQQLQLEPKTIVLYDAVIAWAFKGTIN